MAKRENAVIARELRQRGEAELKSLLDAKKEELQRTRFKHMVGQLRQTHTLNQLKQDIARLQTVVAEVTRSVRHPKYSKFVKRRIRYKAHDEQNECNVGDVVLLEETRPLSKTKRWRVKEIVQKTAGI